MHLLEYLREKNKMTKEEWKDTFEKEEIEILALTDLLRMKRFIA